MRTETRYKVTNLRNTNNKTNSKKISIARRAKSFRFVWRCSMKDGKTCCYSSFKIHDHETMQGKANESSWYPIESVHPGFRNSNPIPHQPQQNSKNMTKTFSKWQHDEPFKHIPVRKKCILTIRIKKSLNSRNKEILPNVHLFKPGSHSSQSYIRNGHSRWSNANEVLCYF